jgi:hypothetical protein
MLFSKFKKPLCGDVQRAEPEALWDNSSLTLLAHKLGGPSTQFAELSTELIHFDR